MVSTTEALFAAPFLMRKLLAENFQYPFGELDTPVQYAYRLMGNDAYAREHTYSIMTQEGRMDSFNQFMEGKFMKTASAAERLNILGYDLGAVLQERPACAPAIMVDIGGGRGELLLDFKAAFPQLKEQDLVVQEFNEAIERIPGVTLSTWNFKEAGDNPQPIQGAQIYHLSHILHNLPDLEAAQLLRKIRQAMAPYSRLLIHQFSKNTTYAAMHATMAVLYGGRERSSAEWQLLADVADLNVTFEAYPVFGEGLVEMRKI